MFVRISKVFFILGTAVSFGLVKNILLARMLSKSDFGLFNLIATLAGFIYPISMLGQQNTIVRFFSKNAPADYNWREFLGKVLLASLLLGNLGALIAGHLYGLSTPQIAFLITLILASVLAELHTYIYRAMGRYESAVILHRSVRILQPIGLVLLAYLSSPGLNSVFLLFAVMHIVHVSTISFWVQKNTPLGVRRVTSSQYKEGALILGADLSLLVVASVDKLLLGKMVTLEEVGVYFAIFSLTRVFELVINAIEYVLLPQANKSDGLNLKRMVLRVFAAGILVGAMYLTFGDWLTHFVYSGKYDDGARLIPLFCLIGLLRLLYIVPSSIISGRLPSEALQLNLYLNSALMVLNIVMAFWFIRLWQIPGALAATALVWFLRMLAAYFILGRYTNAKPNALQFLDRT